MRNGWIWLKSAVIIILILTVSLWSGTTGKIAGTVIDKQTGEPLGGANVVVQGTDYGAAADLNGNYTILHIPPGEYTVVITVMGYAKVTVNDVRVRIDQTSHISVEMEMEAVEGQAVTIVADRMGIKPDVATSVVSVTGQEVESLPVSSINGVVGLQAGVEGGLRIRGSDGEAVLYMVNGVTMRDPRNNRPISQIALSAVKEISIERGGFDAEYGQVQAGVVNVVTQEGTKNGYFGNLITKIGPPAPKYYRGDGIPDVHDPDSYWMRPYLDDDVCWTGTTNGAWDEYTRKEYLSFNGFNAISQQLMTDGDPDNDLTPLGAQRVFMYETRKPQTNDLADYEIDAGFGGPVPFLSEPLGNLRFFTSYRRDREVYLWAWTRPDYVNYDWSMQITSDINQSMKLQVQSVIGNVSTMENNWAPGVYYYSSSDIAGGTGGNPMFNLFSDWALCLTDLSHRTFSSKLTHTLNQNTFYEVSLEYVQRKYFTRPTAVRDTSTLYEILPGYYRDENPFGYWPSTTEGIVLGIGEQASLARDNTKTSSTTLKADITSQLNFNNLMKAGVEFVYNDLDLDYGVIQMQTQGKTFANRVQMQEYPIRAAMYVQDKLETKGFTMKAGLRLDYSNSKTDWWDFNPYDPYFISSKYDPSREFDLEKSQAQWQLSPRLGISHPITENSKLYFNYGHFKQMPQYDTIFRVSRNQRKELTQIGNPNLTLAKTISYELGYDHILFNELLLQLSAFYRDITDQANMTRFQSINGDVYNMATSNTYEDIRGFELTLRKNTGRWLTGFGNYTYQVTTEGNFGQAELYQDPSAQKRYDENTENLYQQRPVPTPYARLNLDFHTPVDFGPEVIGHPVLGGLNVNLLLDWRQGGWTTYNPKNTAGISLNLQYVDWYNASLRASKTFRINKLRIQLLMDVYNLFNTLRLRDTGSQDYRLSLHLPESDAYDNIPGSDKLGDYRKPGVEWQPIQYISEVDKSKPDQDTRVIYYEGSTSEYWNYTGEEWMQVDQKTMDQINEDKAYIYNAGPSTYWFLDPRSFMFGIRVSFDLN
jgi:outer membrane receptor protein involved in Fe transport